MTETTALDTLDKQFEVTEGQPPLMRFLENMDALGRMSKMLAKSGMFKHRNPETIGAIVLTAMEMQIPVTVALRGMYVVHGAVGVEGQLMLAMAIERCGVTVEQIERSPDRYAGTLRRPNWPDLPIEFTTGDALTAKLLREKDGSLIAWSGKTDQPWDNWRKDMLQWRAIAQGLRVIAPDYFANVYSIEEVKLMEATDALDRSTETSDVLRGHLIDDIDEDIAKLSALRTRAEQVEVAGTPLLSEPDLESIAHVIAERDAEAITQWCEEITRLLKTAE